MQTDNYRENLKEALRNLIKVNESIYGSIIDISMQGELKEFNDAVPIGETHQFDFAIFKNSNDTNIQLLIGLMDKVEETFESIVNINGINTDEE
jgi:hypothetical protein